MLKGLRAALLIGLGCVLAVLVMVYVVPRLADSEAESAKAPAETTAKAAPEAEPGESDAAVSEEKEGVGEEEGDKPTEGRRRRGMRGRRGRRRAGGAESM